MNIKENYLRAANFETPEYIPMNFHINRSCWQHYPQDALQELMADHPFLFPGFKTTTEKIVPTFSRESDASKPYTDSWGCVWTCSESGMVGTVTEHPLASWNNFDSYIPPDPSTQNGMSDITWDAIAKQFELDQESGDLKRASLPHGHTFLKLLDIRGYENTLYDMFDDEPRFLKLLQMLEDFNYELVTRNIELGAEWMGYPEDLGMQNGPMLSPEHFKKYIRPVYERLVKPARDANCLIHMHSDGDIREFAFDLVDMGINIINLQDLVNGIDWIKDNLAGKVCIDLDIDRQKITPFGTPEQIDALIREEVQKFASKKGGLVMLYGMYPGIPLENVKAVMDAMEKYATYYS